MNPTKNPQYCQAFITQTVPTATPEQFGCTSWDACQFLLQGSSWPGSGEDCCGNAPVFGTGCCGGVDYAIVASVDDGACVKVGYDEAYRQACCFGTAENPALQCDPSWCPSDPQGECTALFLANCTGSSTCGRHKFLTPSITGDMNGAPCNLWYLAAKDNAVNGYYWTSATDDSTLSLDPLLSVTFEIDRFCRNEGATSGECSCYNAYLACTVENETDGGCLIAADTGSGRDVVRRVDIYCNGGFSTTTDAGAWVTLSNTCDPNATYGSPTINPGSSNPYAPPDGVSPFPAHCWLPACQYQTDDCIFKNLPDLRRTCPPICMQFASGNNVVINGTTTPAVHVNIDTIDCSSWQGVTSVSTSPFVWPSSEIFIEMPVGAVASFTIPLTNTSLDSATNFNTFPTDLFSTLEPIVVLPQAAANPLALPNNTVTSVWVTVDTGALFADQFYEGALAAVDHTKANAPAFLYFALDVAGSDAACTVTIDDKTTLTPATTPSTRPTDSAPALNFSSVQGHVVAPPGARGQETVRGARGRARRLGAQRRALQQSQKEEGAWPWWALTLAILAGLLLAALVVGLVVRRARSRPSRVPTPQHMWNKKRYATRIR